MEEPKGPTGDEESSLPEDGDSSLTRYGAAKGATISVSGQRHHPGAGGYGYGSLGRDGIGAERAGSQSAMNAKIEAIRQALLESGIDEKSINTDRLNIYTNYSYAEDGTERVSSYTASSTLSIVTQDMDATGAIIDTAFGAGANTLNGHRILRAKHGGSDG